jgi:TolB protein
MSQVSNTAMRALLVTALASLLMAAPAAATFPGRNGPIAFRQIDPDTGLGVPLFRVLPDGTGMSVISRRPGFFSDWRADGRRIAFDFFQANDEQIATAKPDGSDVRVITSGHGIHEVPSWSPDGRRIVFDYSPEADPETPGFHTRLWTMRSDGSHPRPLRMQRPGFDVEPRYSPDGRWIAFGRLRTLDDGSQLQAVFIVRADGGRARRLTPWALNSEHPTWSPDSGWIVFDNAPDGTIQATRPNGHKRHTVLPASTGHGYHKPSFSPDGTRIVSMCENQGTLTEPPTDYDEDICVMNADGSGIVHLTDTPRVLENWPSWGPMRR